MVEMSSEEVLKHGANDNADEREEGDVHHWLPSVHITTQFTRSV
jgi:hypothetical protein